MVSARGRGKLPIQPLALASRTWLIRRLVGRGKRKPTGFRQGFSQGAGVRSLSTFTARPNARRPVLRSAATAAYRKSAPCRHAVRRVVRRDFDAPLIGRLHRRVSSDIQIAIRRARSPPFFIVSSVRQALITALAREAPSPGVISSDAFSSTCSRVIGCDG